MNEGLTRPAGADDDAGSDGDAGSGERSAARDGRRARSGEGRSQPHSQPIVAALGKFGLSAAGHLPPAVSYWLGGALGRLYSFFPTRDVAAARVNLELCFPELPAAERRKLLRDSFAHTGRFAFELGRVWFGGEPGDPGFELSAQGKEVLDRALERGKGALVLCPHLGSWEIMGLYLTSHYETTVLYRPPRIEEMDAVYRKGRLRHGPNLVPAGAGGVRAIQRALRDGKVAVVLPDQDPGRGNGVFVPFFGHPANTGTLVARLASRSGAAVLTGYARRQRGSRFEVHLSEADPSIGDPDSTVGAEAINRSVERCVRELPEQYLWSYKRFRFQPKGTPSPYKRSGGKRSGGKRSGAGPAPTPSGTKDDRAC